MMTLIPVGSPKSNIIGRFVVANSIVANKRRPTIMMFTSEDHFAPNGQPKNAGMTCLLTEALYVEAIRVLKEVTDLVRGDVTIHLPKIAVVGQQSSGKSSLLGALVDGMHEIFPTSTGLCTKVPIEVRLSKSEPSDATVTTKAIKKDGGEVAQQDTWDTDGRERACSFVGEWNRRAETAEIVIDVKHPQVSELVLVDLPGLQAAGTYDDVVKAKISNDYTVVLQVAKAEADYENDRCDKFLRDHFKFPNRILRVWTKCDCFEGEASKASINKNMDTGLSRGVLADHAVSCRSQEKPITWAKELDIFAETFPPAEYPAMKEGLIGCEALFVKRLPPLLAQCVLENQKAITDTISKKQAETQRLLRSMSDRVQSPSEIRKLLLEGLKEPREKEFEEKLNKHFNDFLTQIVRFGLDENMIADEVEKTFLRNHDISMLDQTTVPAMAFLSSAVISVWENSHVAKLEQACMQAFGQSLAFPGDFEFKSRQLSAAFDAKVAKVQATTKNELGDRIKLILDNRRRFPLSADLHLAFVPPVDNNDPDLSPSENSRAPPMQYRRIAKMVLKVLPVVKAALIDEMWFALKILTAARKSFLETLSDLDDFCVEDPETTERRRRLLETNQVMDAALRRMKSFGEKVDTALKRKAH